MRVFASTLVQSEVWHPTCHEHLRPALTRRCHAKSHENMRGCHDQLAYELLYARRRGSKCCFQSATRSRTERPVGEPSPLPDSSGPSSSEAKPGGTRRRDLPKGWKRS